MLILRRNGDRLTLAVFLASSLAWLGACTSASREPMENELQIGPDDIGGVVESESGGEAGVWVIAESKELPDTFRKIVVTDDDGRFLLPDLPEVTYRVWVRGYGLKESSPVEASLGQELSLAVEPASTQKEAAQLFPANYWYSLIEPPKNSEFPGTGPEGNGISPDLESQAAWIDVMKQGCQLCHQLGSRITREIDHLDRFESHLAAWDHRVQTGQRGTSMNTRMNQFGRERALRMFAEWTERIAAGEVPKAPPRPQGVERNVVLTMWEWASPTSYIHDEIATDKRQPTINAGGPVYGVSAGHGRLVITDPTAAESTELEIPIRDDPASVPSRFPQHMLQPSYYWSEELLFGTDPDGLADPHNPMMDGEGRVWMTSTVRGRDNPDWCKEGSSHPSAKYFPLTRSARQVSYYDPNTQEFALIDTCYGTHHLQFAEDEDDTLWFSGGGEVIGWLNTKLFDETGNEQAAQGWCPAILDTNGDGKIGDYVEPNEPLDPALDKRMRPGAYGIIVNPVDGSIWAANTAPFPGRLVRLDPGDNPPETCIAEVYEPPSIENPEAVAEKTGHAPRGIDVDRSGIIWTALSGSGHLASFDRSKCAVLNGPTATGQHCPEGWTLYPAPGPQMKGVTDPGSADFHYYNWVDQFDTLGLGENIPIATGSGSDSLLALLPDTGEWVILRVPYPLGFFTRGLDGRIDDAKTGWKGRGLWANYGTHYNWHIEGGKGTPSSIIHFQLRPDPLAN